MPVTAAQPMAGGSAPAKPADHDVLRRAALQPERIDDDIEEDGEGQQRRPPGDSRTAHHGDRRRPPASSRSQRILARDMAHAGWAASAVRVISASMSLS